jgi:hypothetical protein
VSGEETLGNTQATPYGFETFGKIGIYFLILLYYGPQFGFSPKILSAIRKKIFA